MIDLLLISSIIRPLHDSLELSPSVSEELLRLLREEPDQQKDGGAALGVVTALPLLPVEVHQPQPALVPVIGVIVLSQII